MQPKAKRTNATMSVRLHAPRPHEVLARVAGTVDSAGVDVLVQQISASFDAAAHVVLDLSGVTALTPAGVEALVKLKRVATHRGTQLRIVGGARAHAARHAMDRQLPPPLDGDDVTQLEHGTNTESLRGSGRRGCGAADPFLP
ncbi:STAS domain-containing protein [Pseudonocardia parietis]|uniref:ABC-type transporter Mla MlaB component n=1 Tax=Pseudonocardia parietis TaxID=570936 RepID=A0ABS4W6V6_9PSEU|nr:STAS domain-containing protein [Pseudonocardia parietis]MBP2371940.1 ABC-type transporter Mla MlaB component [Pseudonocardia parietis]